MTWGIILFVVAAGVFVLVASLGKKEPGSPPSPAPFLFEEKVEKLTRVIGKAEGFGVPGAVPSWTHNPGDLGPGDTGDQYKVYHAHGSDVSILPDDETGWEFLRVKVRRILSGQSRVFFLTDTIAVFGQKYVGAIFPEDSRHWSNTVAQELGVDRETTIGEWLGRA